MKKIENFLEGVVTVIIVIVLLISLSACPTSSTNDAGVGVPIDTIENPPIEMVMDTVESRSATTQNFFDPETKTYSLFSGGKYNQFVVYGEAITVKYTLFKSGVYRVSGAQFPWVSEYTIQILDESLLLLEEYNALIQSNNTGREYDF